MCVCVRRQRTRSTPPGFDIFEVCAQQHLSVFLPAMLWSLDYQLGWDFKKQKKGGVLFGILNGCYLYSCCIDVGIGVCQSIHISNIMVRTTLSPYLCSIFIYIRFIFDTTCGSEAINQSVCVCMCVSYWCGLLFFHWWNTVTHTDIRICIDTTEPFPIPTQLQPQQDFTLLSDGLRRSYVWWPNGDPTWYCTITVSQGLSIYLSLSLALWLAASPYCVPFNDSLFLYARERTRARDT